MLTAHVPLAKWLAPVDNKVHDKKKKAFPVAWVSRCAYEKLHRQKKRITDKMNVFMKFFFLPARVRNVIFNIPCCNISLSRRGKQQVLLLLNS